MGFRVAQAVSLCAVVRRPPGKRWRCLSAAHEQGLEHGRPGTLQALHRLTACATLLSA
jgi:hypothetical protein